MAELTQNQLPVRVYQTEDLFMVATPMPGLEPQNISVTVCGDSVTIRGDERGPGQHRVNVVSAEWTIGPYMRQLTLPGPVDGAAANASYGNGVLTLSLPKRAHAGAGDRAVEFRLEPVFAVRGERVGHTGRALRPSTTAQHRRVAQDAQRGTSPGQASRPGA